MKYCLILGSNSDVGQACAHRFAQEGFHLLLASRNIDEYQQQLASDIAIRHQVEATPVLFEGRDYEQHDNFIQQLPHFPDVVVSVFGYLGDHEMALKDFREAHTIIDANFTGHVSLLGRIANQMEAKKEGTIIGVSSVAGERGRQSNYLYGAAKAGFTAYLSGLRNRLTPVNVHVASIIPGFIQTKMLNGLETPKPLTAQPSQVANAIWNVYKKKKNVVYSLPIWRLIMLIIRNIPEFIFKKLKL